jgi:hypothetical protein
MILLLCGVEETRMNVLVSFLISEERLSMVFGSSRIIENYQWWGK